MSIVKRQNISWSDEEKKIVFKSIDHYIQINSDFPCSNNYVAFERFQENLPVHRRKKLGTYSTVHVLKKQYFEYVAKQKHVFVATNVKTDETVTKPQKQLEIVLDHTEPVNDYPKLSDVSLEHFVNLLDSKFILLYKSINDLIEESNKKLPKIIIDTILSQDSSTTQPEVAPIVKPVETIPEPVIEEKPTIQPVEVVETVPPPVEPVLMTVSESSECSPRMFTEAEIRSIIRSEIESIFGPIKVDAKSDTKVHKDVKHAEGIKKPVETISVLVDPVSKVYKDVEIKEVKKEPKSIYIYGLDGSKFQNVKKYFGHHKHLTIEGSEFFNHDMKHKAKNTDLIIVTKYSSHSVLETLKNNCDNSKIEFVPGGLTTIKNKIKSFLDETV